VNEKCQQQNITSKILMDEEPTDSRITSNTGNDQSSGSIDPLDPQPVGILLKIFQGTIENGGKLFQQLSLLPIQAPVNSKSIIPWNVNETAKQRLVCQKNMISHMGLSENRVYSQ